MFLLILAQGVVPDVNGQIRNTEFGVFDIPSDERSFEFLDDLGVGWVREQYRLGEADMNLALTLYSRIFLEDHRLFLTLYHRDPGNIPESYSNSFANSSRGAYPPADTTIYKDLVITFVGALVDEIASQGKAPGEYLTIQFCNEVLPTDIVPDNSTRFWHGTADEYLSTVALTYRALQDLEQGPIPLANGGISSLAMEEIVKYERDPTSVDPIFEQIRSFNDRVLREATIDWVDVHLRHAKEDLADKINWVRDRWSGPLVAAEFAGPDPRTGIEFTEALQAQELVERMDIAREEGVDIIFWSHLMENPAVEDIYFQEGLLEFETWREKPAFVAYKEYIERFDMVLGGFDAGASAVRNFPNPFSGYTTFILPFPYEDLKDGWLDIYDLRGKRVVHQPLDNFQSTGKNHFQFDGRLLAEGIYLYRLGAGPRLYEGKMIVGPGRSSQ